MPPPPLPPPPPPPGREEVVAAWSNAAAEGGVDGKREKGGAPPPAELGVLESSPTSVAAEGGAGSGTRDDDSRFQHVVTVQPHVGLHFFFLLRHPQLAVLQALLMERQPHQFLAIP